MLVIKRAWNSRVHLIIKFWPCPCPRATAIKRSSHEDAFFPATLAPTCLRGRPLTLARVLSQQPSGGAQQRLAFGPWLNIVSQGPCPPSSALFCLSLQYLLPSQKMPRLTILCLWFVLPAELRAPRRQKPHQPSWPHGPGAQPGAGWLGASLPSEKRLRKRTISCSEVRTWWVCVF